MQDVYVIIVNEPGYLPESEPYAVRGADMAYECARTEGSGEIVGYSRAEFMSALEAGGVSFEVDDSYVCEVVPLASLGLPAEDVAAYLEDLD